MNQDGVNSYSGADAATVINSALSNLTATGGKVFVKEGNYSITTSLVIDDPKEGIWLEGSGRSTILSLADGANCHVIDISSATVAGEEDNPCYVSNLFIYGNSARNTGNYDGIHIDLTAEHPRVFMVWINYCARDGIYSYGHSGFFSNIRANYNKNFGIEMLGGYSVITQCIADENGVGGIFIDAGDCIVSSCRLGADVSYGVQVTASSGSGIYDCSIYACDEGIRINSENVSVSNNIITGGSYGVYIVGGYSNIAIRGNKFMSVTTPIRLNTPEITHPTVEDNDWTGCTDPTVAATNPVIAHNVGCDGKIWAVMENSGSATNATATTFSIAHGLIGPPTGVWASFSTIAVSGWTWTANSTTITVTVAGTGLPSSMTVYWKAEYNP
jgi:hypothetical protein